MEKEDDGAFGRRQSLQLRCLTELQNGCGEMNFILGVLVFGLGSCDCPLVEFSLMPTDMVRKPQDKPVMECRDMKVGA